MKERPILFSGPMVRALFEGRKTQTRRVVKPLPDWGSPQPCCEVTPEGWQGPINRAMWSDGGTWTEDEDPRRCPYGQPGDRLWVRETFQRFSDDGEIMYRADAKSFQAMNDLKLDGCLEAKWRPSIHMPRWASRISLEVTGVRVERLQEISNTDAFAEGAYPAAPHRHGNEGLEFEYLPGQITRDPYAHRHNTGSHDCGICTFKQIWQSINGPGSWDANPFVWVVEFKLIAQEGK